MYIPRYLITGTRNSTYHIYARVAKPIRLPDPVWILSEVLMTIIITIAMSKSIFATSVLNLTHF